MTLNLLIVVCLACWSAWGIFDKKALETGSHLDVLLFQHIFYLAEIPFLVILLNALNPMGWPIASETWLLALASSIVSSMAMLFYLVALSRSEASYVLGITAGYPVVAQLLASIFLRETVVATRLLGSVLVCTGVALIGVSRSKAEDAHHPGLIDLIFCLLATVCWGFTGLIDKTALMHADTLRFYFARCLSDVVFLGLFAIGLGMIKHRVVWRNRYTWKFCGFSAMCLILGTSTYLFALKMSTASYVIVITGCYPLFTYIFTLLFLKEKMQKWRLAGIIGIVIGGLLVQSTQSQ